MREKEKKSASLGSWDPTWEEMRSEKKTIPMLNMDGPVSAIEISSDAPLVVAALNRVLFTRMGQLTHAEVAYRLWPDRDTHRLVRLSRLWVAEMLRIVNMFSRTDGVWEGIDMAAKTMIECKPDAPDSLARALVHGMVAKAWREYRDEACVIVPPTRRDMRIYSAALDTVTRMLKDFNERSGK